EFCYETVLRETWEKIVKDTDFFLHAEEAESLFSVPSWKGDLSDYSLVQKYKDQYSVLGIDGSQVYPDHHQLYVQQALINIGGISIEYGSQDPVSVFSEPELFSLYRLNEQKEQIVVTTEWINLEREAREFEVSVEKALAMKKKGCKQLVVLFDGTLLFYHLISVNDKDRQYFFDRYCKALQILTDHAIPFASYLSAPQNKDLINLIKLGLCRFKRANCRPCHEAYETFPCEVVDTVSDRQLMSTVLPRLHRSIFFRPASMWSLQYLENLQPYFSYYHGAQEVGRIEMPAWIVQDDAISSFVYQVIVDQIEKGYGYPVVLAEAHEQAVVKQADKEYFYQVCARQASDQSIAIQHSEKSIKKKQMPY
ncbi:DNA double-strand break repair nuclease NurA, partial [Candidatus Babeliales bacterium]|nr:DNA double-strand break repair nuclease NurA [Candidatus Babeliales bacterium]